MLQWDDSAILSTFITLQFVIRIFVLSIFEWPLKTGFTVSHFSQINCIQFKICQQLDLLKIGCNVMMSCLAKIHASGNKGLKKDLT